MDLSNISLNLNDVAKRVRRPRDADGINLSEIVVEIPLTNNSLWTIIPVKNSTPKVRLDSDALRAFIHHSMDVGIIDYRMLANPGDHPNTLAAKRMHSEYPITSFFLNMKDFVEVTEEDLEGNPELTFEQFASFVNMLEESKVSYDAEAKAAFESGFVTFANITSFFDMPGRKVALTKTGEIIGFVTDSCKVVSSFFSGNSLEIKGNMLSNCGKGLSRIKHTFNIPEFRGSKSVKDLGLYDLDNDTATTQYLLKRGQKYLELTSKVTYANYTGKVARLSYYGPKYFKGTGRIMIDIISMRNVDSNYDYYFGYNRYSDREENEISYIDPQSLSEQDIVTLPPYVYGNSLVSKIWGQFSVDNISEINFRTDAYDKLVLDLDTKDMIFSLVETEYSSSSDLIDGKGGGCIFLLEGPPGVGKTLTAEAVAETLKRPLYMVGIGELGTTVEELEFALKNILEIAASWNAVLLIDEADIFLAERSDLHIERNAMVGVFLRLLEYYSGILFLTTNLAGTIDQAFYSRISMAIHYEDLDVSARTKVWNNLLSSNKVSSVDVGQLSPYKLNGRQIKNIIRNGSALAKKADRKPSIDDFTRVINKTLEFEASMKSKRGIWNRIKSWFN